MPFWSETVGTVVVEPFGDTKVAVLSSRLCEEEPSVRAPDRISE